MLQLILTLALMSCAQTQDYHYPRPHLPFHLAPQRPAPLRQPPRKIIVQTFGPHGRTYELKTYNSPTIYVAHESYAVPGSQQHPQHQQHPLQPHQIQHYVQQLSSSAYKNPLLVNTNYPQVTAGLAPPPSPGNYYAPAQALPSDHAHLSQPADSYYRQPTGSGLTVATATHSQPAASYGPPQEQLPETEPQQQQQQQPQPHHSNPRPYAVVTLPHGEHVLDAGHGSGPVPATGPMRVGDYNAQSPSATLDTYNYKQSVPGDVRSYQRHVTNCPPNGQCQQLQLNPGQIDPDHHQLLQAARAQTQPAKSNCNHENFVPPGAEHNAQGHLRPRGRRTYAHVQEQLAKYPYN